MKDENVCIETQQKNAADLRGDGGSRWKKIGGIARNRRNRKNHISPQMTLIAQIRISSSGMRNPMVRPLPNKSRFLAFGSE
jgi:hypothetical protein